MKRKIWGYLLVLIGALAYIYVELPVFNPKFTSLYVMIAGIALLLGFFSLKGPNFITVEGEQTFFNVPKLAKFFFSIGILAIVVTVAAPFVLSAPFLHSNKYRDLLGNVEESQFTSDISPVSVSDIRLVDRETAIRLGDKKIGEVPALGSISKLGEFHIQQVNGSLYWVAPLVHRDTIKWLTNLEGTTGYIMVSANNPQDVRFVQELDGKPVKIVYQPDAYLHQDLARHVYLNGHTNVGLTDFTFEIDDNGVPFWVVSLYEHTIGFGGSDAVGVATVNASTGEVASYTIEEAPAWIDRIQPESFINAQIRDWGLYVEGFLNAVITEANVLVPTRGMSLVYGDDGKSYWYTGITSSGADESTIGFMLVDTRTKEAKLYKQPGATEIAAMRSAEGKVQEKGYTATFPVMYNILGQPTYVMSLKDKAGLIKMVSFVSVEDYSLVGLGENKEDALRSYQEALKSKGNQINIGNQATHLEAKGIITRFNADVQSGNTYYYFMIDTMPNIVFIANSNVSKELPLTQIGDSISLLYNDYSQGNVDLAEFDNLALSIE
ncbi:MAG: hypothetical protein RR448_01865 [Niameybacter sp.]|uniref:hypothetical protein n=1 Tax=Niameybacter sp. TaxID=2033640 RepID=UPI002FCA4B95